jgi:hypothetical protein
VGNPLQHIRAARSIARIPTLREKLSRSPSPGATHDVSTGTHHMSAPVAEFAHSEQLISPYSSATDLTFPPASTPAPVKGPLSNHLNPKNTAAMPTAEPGSTVKLVRPAGALRSLTETDMPVEASRSDLLMRHNERDEHDDELMNHELNTPAGSVSVKQPHLSYPMTLIGLVAAAVVSLSIRFLTLLKLIMYSSPL